MTNLMMQDPDLLKLMIDLYFEARLIAEEPPTVPGLALAMGFNRVQDIVRVLQRAEDEEEFPDDRKTYPEESVSYVLRALTTIEDMYISSGLRDRMPAALVKFTLGAYHGVKEPGNNQNNAPATLIQIAFESPKQQISMRDSVDSALSMNSPKALLTEKAKSTFEVKLNG